MTPDTRSNIDAEALYTVARTRLAPERGSYNITQGTGPVAHSVVYTRNGLEEVAGNALGSGLIVRLTERALPLTPRSRDAKVFVGGALP